jgi:ankyrin repeat protein
MKTPTRERLQQALQKKSLSKYPIEALKEGLNQKSETGWSLYHEAAFQNHFEQVPRELIKLELLLETDTGGRNAFHLAAWGGSLQKFPKEYLTKENLLQTNKLSGKTCLHYAAQAGFLREVPPELLTEENLLTEDAFGEDPFCIAAVAQSLSKLPKLPLETLKKLKIHFESQPPKYAPKSTRKLSQWANTEIKTLQKSLLKDLLEEANHHPL